MPKRTIEISDETIRRLNYCKVIYGTRNINETLTVLVKDVKVPEMEDK